MGRLRTFLIPALLGAGLLGLAPGAGAQEIDLSKPIDCGPPPSDKPVVPNGAEATAEELRTARNDVSRYSENVTAWLNCRDRKAQVVFQFMTKEQQQRWNEDLDTVHTGRVKLERSMNQAIRAFNKRLREEGRGEG